MSKKFDVDPHALAEEMSLLLRAEKTKPTSVRMSFGQLIIHVLRGHNIRAEEWVRYKSEIGVILRKRPRKAAKKEQSLAFDPRRERTEGVYRGMKFQAHSFFLPPIVGGELVVEIFGEAELRFCLDAGGKIEYRGGKDVIFHKEPKQRFITLGTKIAKSRFNIGDDQQGELSLS